MTKNSLCVLAVAALAGLAACGAEEMQEGAAPGGEYGAGAPAVPDQPAPAISDPASPPPVGTDVGAVQQGAPTAPALGDTAAGRYP